MEKFKEFCKKRKDTLSLSILVSVVLPLIVCLVVPFDIFKNNYQEFNFSLGDFLPFCLLLFVAIAILIFVVSNLLPTLPRKIVLFLGLAVALLMFIQGTYLNGSINSLDGDSVATITISLASKIINISVWAIIIAGFIVCACLSNKMGGGYINQNNFDCSFSVPNFNRGCDCRFWDNNKQKRCCFKN